MMQKRPIDPALQVHDFLPSHTSALHTLYNLLHLQRPLSPAQFQHTLKQILANHGRIWCITHNSHILGYATVTPVPGLPGLRELDGGISLDARRQGMGSHLLQHVITALAAGSAQQLSHSVPALTTPAAHFLIHHHFFIEHEELHLLLTDLQAHSLPPADCRLQPTDRQTAVSHFPTLYDSSFAGTPWHQPYTAAEVAATLYPTDELLIGLQEDTPFGFAWVRYLPDQTAEIEPIGIQKPWQGQGYGRSLLNAVLLHLQNKGMQTVKIGVWANNHIAHRLYLQAGFRHQTTTTFLAHHL